MLSRPAALVHVAVIGARDDGQFARLVALLAQLVHVGGLRQLAQLPVDGARGGKLIATEPFFSILSTPIFKYLHHEPVDFGITEPELETVRGPLASANIALPWLIFFRRRDWADMLSENYDVANRSVRFFSAVSYMATGGISHRVPIPTWLYRAFFYRAIRPMRKPRSHPLLPVPRGENR